MENKNILQTTKRRKANWMDRFLYDICLQKHAIEENVERRGIRHKRVLYGHNTEYTGK
jgi:hypothetical protein